MQSADAAEPERPPGVPELGFWNSSVGMWEVSQRGPKGVRDGECLYYRADGTLFSRLRFVAGVQEGPFSIHHPDGALAREGTYQAGAIEGLVRAYASSDEIGGEPLRGCCVPPRAARLDARYRAGELVLETFYDSEGREILSDGSPCPPRPVSLPEGARFDESRRGWGLYAKEAQRFWAVDGTLVDSVELEPGGGRVRWVFDGAGRVAEEHHFTADDKRTGPFFRRLAPGVPGTYADPRLREEQGAFELGQAVGTWTFLDEAGRVVRTVERGRAFEAALFDRSPAFAADLNDGWSLARDLAAEGRVREALCAAARAAARDGNRAALLELMARSIVPLPPEAEAERGEALARSTGADVATILDGLIEGADAAAAFRALSAALPEHSVAALDLVEASLLLAPERKMTHLTRALIRVQRGDEAGARADAAAVEAVAPEAADSLLSYLRVMFRPFEFVPARETLVPDPLADETPEIAQTLTAVQRIAGVYATRLSRVRAGLTTMLGATAEPAWMPPDLSALLPAGMVPLRHERLTCDPDDGADAGAPPETIEIDEELATDGKGVPALLAAAQADYAALGWLCWAVGLDRVAWPEAIAPRATFATAIRMVVERYWRAHDRINTGGLLALTQGIAGFEWQGMEIDLVPRHLAVLPDAEYLAVRSMFLWLVSADALSPFQDDIREA